MTRSMISVLSSLWAWMNGLWCDLMHDDVSWPFNGRYHCRACGRVYLVPWEQPEPEPLPAAREAAPAVRFEPAPRKT